MTRPEQAPVMESRPRHRRTAIIVGFLIALLIAAGLLIVATSGSNDRPLADPLTVALPAMEGPEPIIEYITEFGAPVVEASAFVPDVLEAPDAKQRRAVCERLATEDLPPLGTPRELILWSSGIPDPDTADIANNMVGSLIGGLSECLHDPTGVDLKSLEFHHVVFERRLAEIGLSS